MSLHNSLGELGDLLGAAGRELAMQPVEIGPCADNPEGPAYNSPMEVTRRLGTAGIANTDNSELRPPYSGYRIIRRSI